MFVVDGVTIRDADHPVLVIDLADQPGRTFRVIPSEMWSVENNLSLANMDFDEFADAVDAAGSFADSSDGASRISGAMSSAAANATTEDDGVAWDEWRPRHLRSSAESPHERGTRLR